VIFMVEATTHLVTYRHGPLAAQMSATAEADAVAQFNPRRGLRLSAEARAATEAQLSAALGNDPNHASLLASVQASLGASVRLALAAQLDVHGLWAEGCAAAEARARIQGDIKVTGQMLLDALRADPSQAGVLAPVIAFLREVQVDAGVYAEAYFAVRGRARLTVLGSIIPLTTDSDHAGFTVALEYGYAYIWGAGISGFLDVGVPDVPAAISATVDAAVSELLRLLPAGTAPEVEPLLRMLVPLAATAATAVGRTLGPPQTGEAGPDPVIGDLTRAFLTELRDSALHMVLTAVADAGATKARELLTSALSGTTLTDEVCVEALVACDNIGTFLADLGDAESFTQSLPPLMNLCDVLAGLCAEVSSAVPELAEVEDVLTVAAAAAGALYLLLVDEPGPVLPEGLLEHVRAATGATGPLGAGHLVEYAATRVAKILNGDELGTTGWLTDIFGGTAPDLLTLLWHLLDGQADPAADRALADKAIRAVVAQIKTHLQPILADLPDGNLKQLGLIVASLLDVLETALLPLLTEPGPPDAAHAARARDELDTLLTGVFGAMVVRCLTHVIEPFFDRGHDQLLELADRVDRRAPEFAEFFALANEYDVVFRISPEVVEAALRETADMIVVAHETAFRGAVELMEAFVLLPAETPERREQLAVLADGDGPRVGDAALRTELLDALFARSSLFAVEMVPPSVRMTSMIALDQGPVPLVTLYGDAQQVARSSAAAINDAAHVNTDIAGIVGGILATGKVSAAQLAQMGQDLKDLIGDAAEIVEEVLDAIKTLSWPVFVTSTGGVGLLLRRQFDEFFDDVDWLVEEIRDRVDHLVDVIIQAMVTVAQDLGVLDDDPLNPAAEPPEGLERAVRQAALGDPSQPGLTLLDGRVQISHATIAGIVTNSTLNRDDVRDKVRDFHAQAVEQAERAQKVQLLLAPNLANAQAAEAAMRTTFAAQQRDTGFVFTVTVEGVEEHRPSQSGAKIDVVIAEAGMEFVAGPHPLVSVEIGGRPAVIDPAGWRIDRQGHLRGQFVVYADPLLGAPHPFAAEGLLHLTPTNPDAPAAPNAGTVTAVSDAVAAIRSLDHQHAANTAMDPAAFLMRSAAQNASASPVDATAAAFLPPALHDTNPNPTGRRFPAVLELDRPALLAATNNPNVIAFIANLPGTPQTAFISASVLDDKTGGTSSLTGTGGGIGLATFMELAGAAAAAAADGRAPVTVVARARPGYTTVTASVCAAPQTGQDATTTPRGQATPDWFPLNDNAAPGTAPGPGPDPNHSDATFISQSGVQDVMRRGSIEQVTITMRNSGNTTWTDSGGYRLGIHPQASDGWATTWANVAGQVKPGEDAVLTFPVAAPTKNATFQWQMVRDDPARGREWFGETTDPVQVTLIWDDAAYFSQNVPAAVVEGATAQVTVTVVNTGRTTWTAAQEYQLGALGHDFGAARRPLPGAVPPGQQAPFVFSIPAPPAPSATFQWQMVAGGTWFGQPTPAVQVVRQAAPHLVNVPNVVGFDADRAQGTLKSAGLGMRRTGISGQDAEVSLMNPPAGSTAAEGTVVVCTMKKVPPPPP